MPASVMKDIQDQGVPHGAPSSAGRHSRVLQVEFLAAIPLDRRERTDRDATVEHGPISFGDLRCNPAPGFLGQSAASLRLRNGPESYQCLCWVRVKLRAGPRVREAPGRDQAV